MANEQDYTFTGYLGVDFQLKLFWQLLTDVDFAEKIIPSLEIEYFDSTVYKRFFIILQNFFKTYNKPANLKNNSIELAIKKFVKTNDPNEIELLTSIVEQIKNWNDLVLNREVPYNGDVIQREAFVFIKQQEYKKLADYIIQSIGKVDKSNDILTPIEEKIKKIIEIGVEEDMGVELMDDIGSVLTPEFRKTIPTGINIIDDVTNGGLGNGEMGVILCPLGVGKTTSLTKIANTACISGYNVLQIIFEDTVEQIKRKHFSIWSGIPLSEMDAQLDLVERKVIEFHEKYKPGKLILKRFPQENTTIPKIKQYIDRYQKKFGIKFDMLILDYIDCVESHKNVEDQNARELQVIKAFESLTGELNIPCWTAIQTNRSGINSELVTTDQMGGNIKKAQKAHFIMSVAKSPEQKESNTANVIILKARMAKDGYIYRDVIFNNDTLEIRRLENFQPKKISMNIEQMKVSEEEIKKFNENLSKIQVNQEIVSDDNELDYYKDVKLALEENVNVENNENENNLSSFNNLKKDDTKKILKSLSGDTALDDNSKDIITQQLAQMSKNQSVKKK